MTTRPHPDAPPPSPPLDATAGATLLVDALVEAGISDVVIAPGSRSTPLVAACASRSALRLVVVHDERSGAYLALGLARARGRAAALVTTSGTAVANALPAVVESDVDRVPLVVVSADRPPEAHGTDANQTIEQRGLFGSRVRAAVDVPPPEDVRDPAGLRAALAEALAVAHTAPRGPVHVNAMFRKPLEPTTQLAPLATSVRALPVEGSATTISAAGGPWPASLTELVAALAGARRPLVIAGAAADDEDREGIARLVALLGARGLPCVACALSGLRGRDVAGVLEHGPLLAKAGLLDASSSPFDVVLWLGGAVVTPEVAALAARAPSLWRVDDRRRRRLELGAARVVPLAPGEVAAALAPPAERLAARSGDEELRALDARAAAVLGAAPGAAPGIAPGVAPGIAPGVAPGGVAGNVEGNTSSIDEMTVARLVAAAAARAGHSLFVGNSMPVRDVDLFAGSVLPARVAANRGASGIDGVVSTAAGFALAAGPTVLLVGDVSFLHDAGSLSALSALASTKDGLALRIVVVDNRGGGIFDFLPIAAHTGLMPYFTTPHDVDLVALASAYGVRARRTESAGELAAALAAPAVGAGGLEVLVVPVSPAGPGNDNVARHRALYARLRETGGGPR